ncbi:glycosyltransferase [Sphingobacterium kitahiroshimense]|uniref:Glycosyltransferase n=1 Tax=Sphingobacterium kitahiroshimense TaxID=470446 RepID=A0ABV0BWI5_9SPHI
MYDLMLGLSAEGVHCDMLCASTEGHPPAEIKLNEYATLFVVHTPIKVASTMLAPAMITKLRKIARQYDIIHIHHPDPMATLALYLSGYQGKVVLHWHSDILKQKTLLKLYRPLQEWLINRADRIVGTTPRYVHESPFLQHVQHKVDYVPIGVTPIESDEAGVVAIRNKYEGKNLIFSLGRLVEYKGYEYLIHAAEKLDDRFHIVIGGKGPLQPALTALIAQLGLQDRVTLLGFMDDSQVANYYAAADVYCLSSIWKTEAFAIVQIEAMSCGKPVVSTEIPGSGVSWVNQHDVSGLVVARQNAGALAGAIKRICTDPILYQQYAAGSLDRYHTYFTREKMIQKCLEVYGVVLQREVKTIIKIKKTNKAVLVAG